MAQVGEVQMAYDLYCRIRQVWMGLTVKKLFNGSDGLGENWEWFIDGDYPLVNIQKAIENGPVEIVSFPIEKWWFSIVM